MAAPRFERGSYLAWSLERGAGYRSTGKVDWQFVSLDGVRPASKGLDIDVGELVGEAGKVPPVSIEPTIDSRKVSIQAKEPLVVWPLGESEPTLETTQEEVDYGTVVRVGSLMLAPIDDEQYEAIHDGRLALLEPPAVLRQEQRRDSGSDFLRIAAARQKIGWLWIFSFFGAFFLTFVTSATIDIVDKWGYRGGYYPNWGLIIFFSLGQCITVFCVGAPLHAAVMRWSQTPGYWEDSEDRGIGWSPIVAVPLGALALFASSWILGIVASLLLTVVVCQPQYGIELEDVILLGFFMSILLSFVACIVLVVAVKRRHRIVLRWFGPPSRFLESSNP